MSIKVYFVRGREKKKICLKAESVLYSSCYSFFYFLLFELERSIKIGSYINVLTLRPGDTFCLCLLTFDTCPIG